jgi:hypothetical protein
MGGPGLIAVTTEGADVERLEGDGVYTVPAGVEEIAVTLIGGGGAAGAHAGGEPGDFQPMKLFVRPGSQFRYSVGSGGLPGVNNGKGGDSVFEAV